MSDQELKSTLQQLHQTIQSRNYQKATSLLSQAKIALLNLNALIPSSSVQQSTLVLAREILELGALVSIRLQDSESFTRYYQQLQPFYDLPESVLPSRGTQKSKVTGLYLLLLLSSGDYAGFHTLLEGLETALGEGKLEQDVFIRYPVELERNLMEGSYDKVWRSTKSERVPSEEYSLFSNVSSRSLPSF